MYGTMEELLYALDDDEDTLEVFDTMENFKRIEKIGEGTYGVVYKAIDRRNGKLVAMKRLRTNLETSGIPATTLREVAILRELSHPNIVTLCDVVMTDTLFYLVFEFISMDLKKFMDRMPARVPMDRSLQKSYLYQILQGICYCHQRRVLHRDLKPQNLLVDLHGTIKIADFGLARTIGLPIRAYTHEVVTLWYRAPEILLGSTQYSMAVDMWSVGCIVGEFGKRRVLFHGDSEIDQVFKIFRVLTTPNEETWAGLSKLPDYKPTFPVWSQERLTPLLTGKMDDEAVEIVKSMLRYDPAKRASAKRLLKHPYFKSVDRRMLPVDRYPSEME